jgi:eukaryotic translation initiation factor 2C
MIHVKGQPGLYNGNFKPGLLVDNVVTAPNHPNFCESGSVESVDPACYPVPSTELQSHHAIKGTARTAHYHVLLDENKMPKDNIYKLVRILLRL